ncbi:MAG: TolC family protein [Methanobacterium sp.]
MKSKMKPIIHILCLMFMLGITFPAAASASNNVTEYRPLPSSLKVKPEPIPDFSGKPTLSLTEALDIAYKCNPGLRQAELELDRAEILLDQAANAAVFTETGDLIVGDTTRAFVSSYEQANVNYKTKKKASESEKLSMEKEVVTAYAAAVKSYNQLQISRLTLQDFEAQNKLNMVATVQGLLSNMDLRTSKRSLQQINNSLTATEMSYEASLATLRNLLNQNESWEPVLTSRPTLGNYERNEMWLELSRAADQSVLQMQAKAMLELEQIKKFWSIDGGLDDSYLNQINLNLKELDYEQAQRDTRATIEQLYQAIDILVQQIVIKEDTLAQNEQDLAIAKLKFENGLIPYRSLRTGELSLCSAELAVTKTRLELESLRSDLAQQRANFGYLTGQLVYSRNDWTDTTTVQK